MLHVDSVQRKKCDIYIYREDNINFGKKTEKFCNFCQRTLGLDHFYKRSKNSSKFSSKCKECSSIANIRHQRHSRLKKKENQMTLSPTK